MHVVREVVDAARARRARSGSRRHRAEIDVVDRAIAVAVDEIDQRAADADDGGDVELHRPDAAAVRLRAQLERRARRRRRHRLTRNAMAHADGPCACAKRCAEGVAARR